MRLKPNVHTSSAASSQWLWLGPLIYMLIVGLYFMGRYGGRWAEVDSAIFTEVIRVFAREGQLVPVGGELYPNGYGYQSISAFVLAFTGLDAATLQQLIYPLLAAPIALVAFALFR